MTFSMCRLVSVALAAALAPLLAHAVADSGIFEIDLVFPRNGTYAPVPLMPVVFAVRNPALAPPLGAHISWSIAKYGNILLPDVWSDKFDLSDLNASASNPYLSTSYVPANAMSDIEGTWVFAWLLSTTNCSRSPNPITYNYQDNNIVFTTRNTSQPPDLEAVTSSGTCTTGHGSIFNVTAVEEFGVSQSQSSCAVLGPSPTTRNPCVVTINSSAASSISAAISVSASLVECNARLLSECTTPCPTSLLSTCTAPSSPSSTTSAAGRSPQRHAAWLVTTIASLTALACLGQD